MLRLLAVASLAAAQICPESHPHECSAPTTDSYGPCCDQTADCKCKPAEKVQDGTFGAGWVQRTYLARSRLATPTRRVPSAPPRRARSSSARTGAGASRARRPATPAASSSTRPDLAEACLARCLGDPLCRSFEIAAPPLNAYQQAVSSERFNFEANCCIEHHAADDPAVAELVVTHDGAAADLCKGEAACWTGYELSGTCDAQPAWAASAALRCYSSEENCGQAGANRLKIDEAAEFVKEKGCAGHVHQLFHHCLEEWKEEGEAAGDEYACGHWGHGRGELDWPATSVMVDALADGSLCADSLAAPPPALSVEGGTAWNGADERINQTCTKSRWCIDLEPHWRAVDVDGDMMLNATEVASLLERLQRIITIKEGAEAGERISYPFPERIVALGDDGRAGGDDWAHHRYVGDSAAIASCRWTSSSAEWAAATTWASRRAQGGVAAARATAATSTASTP